MYIELHVATSFRKLFHTKQIKDLYFFLSPCTMK